MSLYTLMLFVHVSGAVCLFVGMGIWLFGITASARHPSRTGSHAGRSYADGPHGHSRECVRHYRGGVDNDTDCVGLTDQLD
jgi:hypothetical protein